MTPNKMFCRQRLYKRDRGSISLSHSEIGNGLQRLMLFGPVIHVSSSPYSLQHRGMAQAGNSSAACRCEKMNLNECEGPLVHQRRGIHGFVCLLGNLLSLTIQGISMRRFGISILEGLIISTPPEGPVISRGGPVQQVVDS